MERRHFILMISIVATLAFGTDILLLPPQIGVFFLASFIIGWVALLILIPMDAKARGKSAKLYAFFTFFFGPVVGVIYFFLAKKKIQI